jgi:hypothetical protein
MLRSIGWLVIGTLVVAAAYELALALGHTIAPGGQGFALLAALVAMLVGAVLVLRDVGPVGLIAPAAALFVTARFYSGDPYYGSTFRAYADGGIFSPVWVLAVLGLSLVAGVTTHFWRRTAPVESVAALFLSAFTAFFMGTGH